MGTTSNRAYRYPALSAPPNVPGDMQNLATDLDTDVQAVYNSLPKLTLKNSGTARTNSTLSDDPVLSGIALPVGIWDIELRIFVTSADASNTGDFKTRWAFTGTYGTPTRCCIGPGSSNVANPDVLTPITMRGTAVNADATYGLSSTGAFAVVIEKALASVTVTGNLSLQWAQAATDSDATTVQAGSCFIVRKFA